MLDMGEARKKHLASLLEKVTELVSSSNNEALIRVTGYVEGILAQTDMPQDFNQKTA